MASDPSERWQAFDEQGQPTQQGLTKQQAYTGLLHGASHVWIWRQTDGGGVELLLQQRAESKTTWPGYFDISAAGHIDFGETPLQAAVRETREEIGLTVDPQALQLLFVHRARAKVADSDIVENELQWVFGLKLPADQDLAYADGEVKTADWVSLEDMDMLIDGEADMRIVPHGNVYFISLMAQLDHHTAVS